MASADFLWHILFGKFLVQRSHIQWQYSYTFTMLLSPELQEHLLYWNNPLESGVVFGSVLVLMVAVKYMSLISVIANLGLALVTSTVAFRIYKSVLSAVKKTEDAGHPFKVTPQFKLSNIRCMIPNNVVFIQSDNR